MAFDMREVLRQITPLFERKLQFMEDAQKRQLTSQENMEAAKVNLEYSKLESQVKGDKEQRALEREKYKAVLANNLDVKKLEGSNILNQERIKGDYELKKQIEANKGIFAAKLLDNTGTRTEYNEDGTLKATSENKIAQGSFYRGMHEIGMGPKEVSPKELNIARSNLDTAIKTGGAQGGQNYLSTLQATNPDAYTQLKAMTTQQAPPPAGAASLVAAPQRPAQPRPVTPPPSIGNMNAGAVPQKSKLKPLPWSMASFLSNQ